MSIGESRVALLKESLSNIIPVGIADAKLVIMSLYDTC
jgi:hypothetical protein